MSVVIFLQNEESLIRILNCPFMVSRAIASRPQIVKKTKVRNFSAAFLINGRQSPAISKVVRASSSHLFWKVKAWLTDEKIFESNLNLQLLIS